ncbi:MAG: hypothetical protein ACU0CN_15130 [Pseudooceanicola nanhaiensis]|uniref:hypothetical protein n=1 Tax=Pseudooceanicola nanhaiensis TaxID=375761 RepID=UPI0040595648
MDGALNLVIGTILMCLAIPSQLSAVMDRRFPLVALLVFCAGAALIVVEAAARHRGLPGDMAAVQAFATQTLPATLAQVPHAFLEVAGQVVSGFY